MSRESMFTAIFTEDNSIIGIDEYDEKLHYKKLKCPNGCNVDLSLRRMKLQNTKTFCSYPKQAQFHTEECNFKRKLERQYEEDFSAKYNISNENDRRMFNSIMRTAKYKLRSKNNKKECENLSEIANSNEKSIVNDVITYIDAFKITEDKCGKYKKVYGIYKRKTNAKTCPARYISLECENPNVSVYFSKNLFKEIADEFSIEDFDKVYEIINNWKPHKEIVVYGEIQKQQNEKDYNIKIRNIDHIVINTLPLKEILKRQGFKKVKNN